MVYGFVVVYGGLFWFALVCGGLFWFMVVCGGVIPKQDYDFLYNAGVVGIFGPGTVIAKSAIDILKKGME